VRVAGTDRGAPALTTATGTMANTITINVMEMEVMPGRTDVCIPVALFPIVVRDVEFTPGPMVPNMKAISRTDITRDREPTMYVLDDVLYEIHLSYSWISRFSYLFYLSLLSSLRMAQYMLESGSTVSTMESGKYGSWLWVYISSVPRLCFSSCAYLLFIISNH
jgi:hypothetical protein